MLAIGKTFTWQFGVALGLLAANSECQWQLVIEVGTSSAATSPSGIDTGNLATIGSWQTVLDQTLLMTWVPILHTAGISVVRAAPSGDASGITVNSMLYGAWSAASGVALSSANFVVRIRLSKFTARTDVSNPRGLVCYAFGGTADPTMPSQITIQ